MKMKFVFIVAIISVGFYLSGCEKESSLERGVMVPTNPNILNADDTSNILNQIEYYYTSGVMTDSVKYFLKNATLNGQKKIKFTAVFGPGDSAFTNYIYNFQNQLSEIRYTNNHSLTDISKTILTWNGDNVIKFEHDSAGLFKYKYVLTYTSIGSNTKVSYSKTPNTDLNIVYTNAIISNLWDYKIDLFVDGNFNPNYVDILSHSYNNNGGGTLPANTWETAKIKFNFSSNGNFANETTYGSRKDTNSSGISGVGYGTDTMIFNYTRSLNDNLVFTNILKSIYGLKLYNLNLFYREFLEEDYFFGDIALKDMQFNNQALNTIDRNQIVWYDGIPVPSSTLYIPIDIKYVNYFDNQNRLIKYTKFDMDSAGLFTIPVYGRKIIYP